MVCQQYLLSGAMTSHMGCNIRKLSPVEIQSDKLMCHSMFLLHTYKIYNAQFVNRGCSLSLILKVYTVFFNYFFLALLCLCDKRDILFFQEYSSFFSLPPNFAGSFFLISDTIIHKTPNYRYHSYCSLVLYYLSH